MSTESPPTDPLRPGAPGQPPASQTGQSAIKRLTPLLAILAAALVAMVVIPRLVRKQEPPAPTPTVGTVVNMQFFFPGDNRALAWYSNQLSQREEGLWYQWTTDTNFRMNHQYTRPTPLDPCLYDEMSWDGDSLWYWATVDTCGPVARETRYPQGIQYLPRWWSEGTQPYVEGITEWVLYEDGQETQRGEYRWAYQVLGWEWLTSDTRALHVKVWGKQSWISPHPTCCMHYEEEWWLGEKDGRSLILRSLGGYREDKYPEWDIWHVSWYPLDPLLPPDQP